MNKIVHKFEKKKSYFLVIVVVTIFSAINCLVSWVLNIPSDFEFINKSKYLLFFIASFILIWTITRADNSEMFQPFDYDEITHKVK